MNIARPGETSLAATGRASAATAAAQLTRLGRVSAAAEVLGMHHSWIIRHINLLEESLRTKLFQRHARGYTPTEARAELLRTAEAVDDEFTRMPARLEHARERISGQLVAASDPGRPCGVASAGLSLWALRGEILYRGAWPAGKDRGSRPDRLIGGEGDFARAPFHRWLAARFPDECFTLMTGAVLVECRGVVSGLGVGFLSPLLATEDRVELFPRHVSPDWPTPIWLVTHVDLHRTPKVPGFAHFVQQEMRGGLRQLGRPGCGSSAWRFG